MLWLKSSDEVELAYLRTVGAEMIKINDERNHQTAQYMVHELAKSLSGRSAGKQKGQNSSSTK